MLYVIAVILVLILTFVYQIREEVKQIRSIIYRQAKGQKVY